MTVRLQQLQAWWNKLKPAGKRLLKGIGGAVALAVSIATILEVPGMPKLFHFDKDNDAVTTPKIDPSPASDLVPHLEAQLIVDSTGPAGIVCRLLLENTSNIAVEQPTLYLNADSFQLVDPNFDVHLSIQPHSKVEYDLPVLSPGPLSKSLEAAFFYHVDNNQSLYSLFTFTVGPKTVAGIPRFPTTRREGAGAPPLDVVGHKSVLALEQSQGSLYLAAPERRPDGAWNNFYVFTPKRRLVVDFQQHFASFQNYQSGQLISVKKRFAADVVHVVTPVWDDRKRMFKLYIDGKN